MMFDDVICKVHEKGYSLMYSNDCQYPCMLIRLFNDKDSRERMVDHTRLSDESTLVKIVEEMLAELENANAEAN